MRNVGGFHNTHYTGKRYDHTAQQQTLGPLFASLKSRPQAWHFRTILACPDTPTQTLVGLTLGPAS